MQAHNYLAGPATPVLISPAQWRDALTLHLWPRTNGALKAKSKKGKARAGSSGADGGDDDGSGGGSSGTKRVRAHKWHLLPGGDLETSESPWPSSRLSGRHAIGEHIGQHFCDYPQCHLRPQVPSKADKEAPAPGSASKRGAHASETASNVSETASEVGKRSGRVKLYCMTCKDPSGARNMNFHADCFNRWHGDAECLQCR